MSKKIEWFDLDGTLWRCDAKWWIIDKTKPDVPLLRISQEEGYLYSSGFYLKDDHRIFYNGMEAWLSNDIFDNLSRQLNPAILPQGGTTKPIMWNQSGR